MRVPQQKVGTVGYYDEFETIANGQTIRTKNVTDQLESVLGKENVTRLCYAGWRRKPLAKTRELIKLFLNSDKIILFPGQNAVAGLAKIAVILSRLFRTKLYFVVIGGWLPSFLVAHPDMVDYIRKYDRLFVQTNSIKNELSDLGIDNVSILHNFRIINRAENKTLLPTSLPVKLVYLSRIEEKKGVLEMVDVVKRINEKMHRPICVLDIYGPVQSGFESRFQDLLQNFPEEIKYCGILNSEEIHEVLSKYDIQLFPTKYSTEGFPGSVLDSFYAGVPILASEWNSAREIIRDGSEGVIFKFGDYEDMQVKLEYLLNNHDQIDVMKSAAFNAGAYYSAEKIVNEMIRDMENVQTKEE